jgi:hypothetical protein
MAAFFTMLTGTFALNKRYQRELHAAKSKYSENREETERTQR